MNTKLKTLLITLSSAVLITACNGGGSTPTTAQPNTVQLSDGTALTMPASTVAVQHGNVASTTISASGGAPDTLLDFVATNTSGPVVSFVQNGVTSGKTQTIQVKVDATGSAPGNYTIPLSVTAVSPTTANNDAAKASLGVNVDGNGAASFTLKLNNNSLVGVNVVAAGSVNASVAAGSSQSITLYSDTVYNLQTVNPAQVLGSLQQSSYYYNLQASPQTYAAVWENLNVSYNSSANGTSGSYKTVLGDGASAPTFTPSCAQDSGSIGVFCQLTGVNGSIANSTISINLTGGYTPITPTPTPTPIDTPSGMKVANYGNWTAKSYDVVWYPSTVYPEVQYNGITYVACSSASASQQPGSSSWTPWVVFNPSSSTRVCP